MSIKKLTAALLAVALMAGAVSCGDKKENPDLPDSGVGELITPAEDSEEYGLGSYRYSAKGVKLYYDQEIFSDDLALAMENYFLTFQNDDFEGYKATIFPDYAERYSAFLEKDYSYGLDGSFDLRKNNLRDIIADDVRYEEDTVNEPTGDFKVTRIKLEPVELSEGEDEESMIKSFFSSYDTIFDMDYYGYVCENTDELRLFCFYVFAEGENGKEYAIVSGSTEQQGPRIVMAAKDGKYYTFG